MTPIVALVLAAAPFFANNSPVTRDQSCAIVDNRRDNGVQVCRAN